MNPELPEIAREISALPEREPFWGYGDLALFVGAALPALVLAVVLLRFASLVWPRVLGAANAKTLAVQVLAYLFLLAALYAVVAWKYHKPFWASLGWGRAVPNVFPLLAAGPVLAIGLASLGVALGLPAEPSQIEFLITSRAWLVVWMLVGVLLAPMFEETVFRGFLLPLFARGVGPWLGIIMTAIPFGLLHGAQNHWAWQPVVLIGLAGAAFGWVRQKTGSTAAAFLLHAAYNAAEFGLYAWTRWAALK